MTRHVMLNNVAHKDLRVIHRGTARSSATTSARCSSFPTEFADVQREYPIFFRKDPATGEFQSVALLGLRQGRKSVSRRRRAGRPPMYRASSRAARS